MSLHAVYVFVSVFLLDPLQFCEWMSGGIEAMKVVHQSLTYIYISNTRWEFSFFFLCGCRRTDLNKSTPCIGWHEYLGCISNQNQSFVHIWINMTLDFTKMSKCGVQLKADCVCVNIHSNSAQRSFDSLLFSPHVSSRGWGCTVTCLRPADRCRPCDPLRFCPTPSATCSASTACRSPGRWTLKPSGQLLKMWADHCKLSPN